MNPYNIPLMRLAVLSDIHGNLLALEAVRKDLRKHAPDVVVNLGDHLSGPLEAGETADLLMSEPWVSIRGNQDRQLFDRPVENMGPSDRAAHGQLGVAHIEWLRSLPASAIVAGDVLLCHGSPRNDLEYLLEDVDSSGPHLSSAEAILSRLDGARGPLILCGHSHIPRFVTLPGGICIANPGSVGLQAYDDDGHFMETGSPHARYALLDRAGSRWTATFFTVEYDWTTASSTARAAGRPDWAYALETGFAFGPKLLPKD